jgi:peptidoglycan hydrolase-like protein with peptidoglycan-binding domain
MSFVGAAVPLNREGLSAAAAHVGVDPVILWSVLVVETTGCGFLPDRRPKILFERHKFREFTNGRFDRSHPGISGPSGGYQGGMAEYERLAEAIACDRRAALESASWGLGQIMGFNAKAAGFRDAEDMVAQMLRGENEQLLGMARFIRTRRIHTALQRRDWREFASGYNGSEYWRHGYHEKLAAEHTRLSRNGLPDLDLRAVQLLLTYHGFTLQIDGILGARTREVIAAFTTKHSLPAMSANLDLHAALRDKLPPLPGDRETPSSPPPATTQTAPDLRIAQTLLTFLGHDPGPLDGRPGPRTQSAISEFQRSRGSGPTGEADAGLLAALETETKRAFERNRIAETRLVQQMLALRGFDPGALDGLSGPRTRAAITAFQQARGAPPTGNIDGGLLDALLSGD